MNGNGRKILIVEDEPAIARTVRAYLEREGYQVLTARTGQEGLEAHRRESPDLVILDWMLPGLSGLDVLRAIRAAADTPVIMLTARTDEPDRVIGLKIGADDYITKPFSPRELVARVEAVLRRLPRREPAPVPEGEVLRYGDLAIDLGAHQVALRGETVPLTPTEFQILACLAAHPRRVFTRAQLLEWVQGYAYEGYERTVDTHVKNLRRKIEEDPARPRYIKTIFGVGYRFDGEG